jgi:hypothetical protein
LEILIIFTASVLTAMIDAVRDIGSAIVGVRDALGVVLHALPIIMQAITNMSMRLQSLRVFD